MMISRNLATCALLMAALAVAPSIEAASVDEFNDGSTAPWVFTEITTTSESGGAIRGTQAGSDPHMERVNPNSALVETDGNQFVHIRLKKPATMDGQAQIFWTASAFNGPESQLFSTTNDNAFHNYVIDLSGNTFWGDGLVGKVRLDPATAAGSGQFEMDYFRISSSATNSYDYVVDNFTNGDFSPWTLSNINSPSETGGLFSATAANIDPNMSRDILDIDGSEATLVRIGMAVTGSSTLGEIFWANEDGGFAAARSQSFTIIPDGAMRTYEIDLSGDLDWFGKTIKTFRLDPADVSGDAFQIDFIEIVAVPEPSAMLMAAIGLIGVGFYVLRRRK